VRASSSVCYQQDQVGKVLTELGKIELAIRLTDPDAPKDVYLPHEIQPAHETRIDIKKKNHPREATGNHVHAIGPNGTLLQVTLKKAAPPQPAKAQALTADGQIIQVKMVGYAPSLTEAQTLAHSAVKHIDDTWHCVVLAFNKLERRLKLNKNDYPDDTRDPDNQDFVGKEKYDLSKEEVEVLQAKCMAAIVDLGTLLNESEGIPAEVSNSLRYFVVADFLQWYGARKYKVTKSKAQLGPDLFVMQLLSVVLGEPDEKFRPKLKSPHGKSAAELQRQHLSTYSRRNLSHLTSHVRRERKHVLREVHAHVLVSGEEKEISFTFMVDDHHIDSALRRLKKVVEHLNFPDGSRMAKSEDAIALVHAAGEYVRGTVGGDSAAKHQGQLPNTGVVRVRVPADTYPGAPIKAIAPDGTEVLMTVPDGAEKGQLLTCHYPITNTGGGTVSGTVETSKLLV
jgi:hypothetical protein